MNPTADLPHHAFGPSSLKHRALCAGWMNDRAADTSRADEGTLLHAACETGSLAGLNEEQQACVKTCLEFIAPLEKGADAALKEQRLNILSGLTYGTADRVIRRGRKAVVVDFKFGQWSVDPAEENLQGFAYALGAFDLFPEVEQVEVVFLLPRRDEVDRAVFRRAADYDRLRLAVQTVIERARAYEATGDPALLTPDVNNCLFCGRKASCPKLLNFAVATARHYAPLEVVEEVHSSRITDPAQMARLFDAAKVMEKLVDSVKVHALQLALEHGGALCGPDGAVVYEVAEREGRRELRDLGLALPALSQHLDDRELLSVATVSLPGALKLISDKAPRGQKSKVVGEVERALREADAVGQGAGSRYLKRVKK